MATIGNKEIMSKNLKYYIARSGKDRRELADAWGIPYSTVTEWINARKYPRIDKIQLMADYFGIQMRDLIEDKKEPTVKDDGLSKEMQELIDCIKKLPEDKVQMLLQVARSIR